MRKPISIYRFIFIWLKFQLRIKLNMLGGVFSFFKKKKGKNKKLPENSFTLKKGGGFIIPVLFFFLYFFLAFQISYQTLSNLHKLIYSNENQNPLTDLSNLNFSFTSNISLIEQFARDKFLRENKKRPISDIRKEIIDAESELKSYNDNSFITFKSRREQLKYILAEKSYSKSHLLPSETADKVIEIYIAQGVKPFKRKFGNNRFLPLFRGEKADELLKWMGFYFLLALIGLILVEGIGSKNPLMYSPEENLENLASLPIRTWVLFLLPFLQRAFLNPLAVYVSFTPSLLVLLCIGKSFFISIAGAIAVTLSFCIILASFQVIYQFLGRFSSWKTLRLVCSFMQIPGYIAFCLILMGGQAVVILKFFRSFVSHDPGGLLPMSIFLYILNQSNAVFLVIPLIFTFIFPVIALFFISFYSKGGLPVIPADNARLKGGFKKLRFSFPLPLLRVVRDRNYFIQTMLMPIVLFGFYFFLFGQGFMQDDPGLISKKDFIFNSIPGNILGSLGLVYGLSSFVALGALFNIAGHEGKNLWLFYTTPGPVTDILKSRIFFWIFISIFYSLLGFAGIAIFLSPPFYAYLKGITLLLGIPSVCFICAGFSFKAFKPPEGNDPPKPKTTVAYIVLWIGSVFGQSVLLGIPGTEFTAPVLLAFVALAVWLDTKRNIPYYLDPDYAPPAELTLKNSMLWVLCFFFLQSITYMIFVMNFSTAELPVLGLLVAFTGGGLFTLVFSGIWYFKKNLFGIPEDHPKLPKSMLIPVILLLLSTLFIFVYFYTPSIETFTRGLSKPEYSIENMLLFYFLTVIAAPLIEEVIFRRYIFIALLRDFSPGKAMIFSAAIFASIHPAISFFPVFCLGLCCSWIYWKSGKLWTAMLMHGLYNLGVVYMSTL